TTDRHTGVKGDRGPQTVLRGPVMRAKLQRSRGQLVLVFLSVCSSSTARMSPDVQFTDITQQSKIDFTQANSATSNKYLIETMGGGVALLDYDNDGRLDVFFTNGPLLQAPIPDEKLPDKSDRRYGNRLYHQNSDGSFTDVTERAGLSGQQGFYSMGVAVG